MLTTDESEATTLVNRLNECNLERQRTQKRVTAEAVLKVVTEGLAQKPFLVVSSKNWNAGVVGIVAGKLVEQFHRPTIVISVSDDGTWGKGSARSIQALDIFDAISTCKDILLSCGGHAYAAGVSLSMENLDVFCSRLVAHAGSILKETDFLPQMRIDAFVNPTCLDLDLVNSWGQLEPFGAGNPAPVLASQSMKVVAQRKIGKDMSHLKLIVAHAGVETPAWQAECVAWGKAQEWVDGRLDNGLVELAYSPSINYYQGRQSLQLVVKDLRQLPTHDSKV